ncbi:MAG: hypothetical protein HUJ65_01275 [Oscillospiraceae bacterium]|nr:hypothetical protein [Oscillospiraceae bacterium]
MKNKRVRVYKSKKDPRALIKPILIIIAAAILLYAILFFSLRKHMVYDGDKAYLDIPWLNEELQEMRESKEAK